MLITNKITREIRENIGWFLAGIGITIIVGVKLSNQTIWHLTLK